MSFVTQNNEQAARSAKNNSEAVESEEITERNSVMDEYALAVGQKWMLKHIVENGDLPEDSPILAAHSEAQKHQKKTYKTQNEATAFTLPEYIDAVGYPEDNHVVDLEELQNDGLWIHEDYSDDGFCHPEIPESHDGYALSKDFEIPSYNSENSDGSNESADFEFVGESEDLTEIPGVGSATADKLNEAGIETMDDLKNANPSDVYDIPGVGDKLMQQFGLQIPEGSDESEEGEGDDESEADSEGLTDEQIVEIATQAALEAVNKAQN